MSEIIADKLAKQTSGRSRLQVAEYKPVGEVPSDVSTLSPAQGANNLRTVTIHRPAETSVRGKRMLIVTPSYPPYTNPRAFRWSAIAERWAREGADVCVISAWTPGATRAETLEGVDVLRVGGGIVDRLRSRLRGAERETITGIDSSKTNDINEHYLKTFIQFGARLCNNLMWKRLYWPDYACLWIPRAARAVAREVSSRRIDTIITVSDPFSSHIVGALVKRRFPSLNWMIDIGDPFCFRHETPTNNHLLYKQLNFATERALFQRADIISVTTEATAEKYRAIFPESKDKVEVIGPLAPPKMGAIREQKAPLVSEKRLVYVGSLYKEIRNPLYLLKLFESLLRDDRFSDWQLHFYGGFDGCQSYFEPYRAILGSRIHLHGLTPRETALRAMCQADVLINIGNDNRYQLPSKVMEYMSSGRPILHVSRMKDDCSSEFFRRYSGGLCLNSEDRIPTVEQIDRMKAFLLNPPANRSCKATKKLIDESGVEAISQKYAAHLFTKRKSSSKSETKRQKPIWHCYYATKGAAGAYVDALMKASESVSAPVRAFVSADYKFNTSNVTKLFFPITDRVTRRGKILKLIRGAELVAGYLLLAALVSIRRPRMVIHLIDDLLVTRMFFAFCKWINLETWLTCHDVRSHYLGVDARRRWIMESADYLIVHNNSAKTELKNTLGAKFGGKVKQYPFPFSPYNDIVSDEEVERAKKGLEEIVPGESGFYLFLGVVRSSKGIETLIQAWTTLSRPEKERLVIAGVWTDPSAETRSRAEADPSITIIDKYLTDAEFVELIQRAKFTVLPYDDYAHSSVIMSCANHGGAAITSDIDLFTEFAPESMWVFERGDTSALRKILQKSFSATDKEIADAKKHLQRAMVAQNKSLAKEITAVFEGKQA